MCLFTHYNLIDQFRNGNQAGHGAPFALDHHDLDQAIEHEGAECLDALDGYALIEHEGDHYVLANVHGWWIVPVTLED